MNLFTYGSLMFNPVWSAVVRGHYVGEEARVRGFQRLRIQGEHYPALIPGGADDEVVGVLYREINADDAERLNRFEGEAYDLRRVALATASGAVEACTYLFLPQYHHLLEPLPWDPEQFKRQGMHEFIAAYRGFSSTADS